MIRGLSLFLGIGLVILWVCGIHQHGTVWLTWLDGLCAVGGLIIAANNGEGKERLTVASYTLALAGGLGLLWLVGLATRREAWLTWWTFAFGCAYLALGVAGRLTERPHVAKTGRLHPV